MAESQSSMRPSSSNSVARSDLVPDRLLGAVMSSAVAVFESAWFGASVV